MDTEKQKTKIHLIETDVNVAKRSAGAAGDLLFERNCQALDIRNR